MRALQERLDSSTRSHSKPVECTRLNLVPRSSFGPSNRVLRPSHSRPSSTAIGIHTLFAIGLLHFAFRDWYLKLLGGSRKICVEVVSGAVSAAVSASDRHRVCGAIPPIIREYRLDLVNDRVARGDIVSVKDVVDLQILVPPTGVTDHADDWVQRVHGREEA